MRVLQVIHGYPPRFNAGSEVYTQALAHELSRQHQVAVFTRCEDFFLPEYHLGVERDADAPDVQLYLVNLARARDRYRHAEVDERFEQVLNEFRPDIVHVGHLNHLSTSVVLRARQRGIPVVYTLHDYWLNCPRGQFIQLYPADPADPYARCDGQDDLKCATHCYARYFSGSSDTQAADVDYWSGWVGSRMAHIREVVAQVNLFLAPSRYLHDRFAADFRPEPERLVFLDYGFDQERLQGRSRQPEGAFVFGYIGTHIPAKGIHHLLQAFAQLEGTSILRIWGRHTIEHTRPLQQYCRQLPPAVQKRIEWVGEYRNQDIVKDVFNRVDAIVVPSIWMENSPLVIHEAQQVRVPVITAAAGGMGEYVHHDVNGLLFRHRDVSSLAEQMQRMLADPALAQRLGARGYLYAPDGDIPSMHEQGQQIAAIYHQLLAKDTRTT